MLFTTVEDSICDNLYSDIDLIEIDETLGNCFYSSECSATNFTKSNELIIPFISPSYITII